MTAEVEDGVWADIGAVDDDIYAIQPTSSTAIVPLDIYGTDEARPGTLARLATSVLGFLFGQHSSTNDNRNIFDMDDSSIHVGDRTYVFNNYNGGQLGITMEEASEIAEAISNLLPPKEATALLSLPPDQMAVFFQLMRRMAVSAKTLGQRVAHGMCEGIFSMPRTYKHRQMPLWKRMGDTILTQVFGV